MASRTEIIRPDGSVPGTKAWARTVASNARRYAGFTEKDVRPLVERYRQLRDREAWDLLFPDELGARERFYGEVLGYTEEFLETMSLGVEILDGRGHKGPITRQEATVVAISEHRGRTVTERETRGNNITSIRGTAETYTIRRLKRDRPDLADRVERSEMSANAAAIEAGFRRKTITVAVARPEAIARSLRKYMNSDDIAKLIALLTGDALSANSGRD